MGAARGVASLQARTIEAGNRRVARQELGHRRGVLYMLPDPERQCLQPLNYLERIRRAERPVEITKQRHPSLQRKGYRAKRGRCFSPDRAMI